MVEVGDPGGLEGKGFVIEAEHGDGAGIGDVILAVAGGYGGVEADADAHGAGGVEEIGFFPGVTDVGLDAGVGIRKGEEIKRMAVAGGIHVETLEAESPGHFVVTLYAVAGVSGADVVDVEGDDDGVIVGFVSGDEVLLPGLPEGGESGGGGGFGEECERKKEEEGKKFHCW